MINMDIAEDIVGYHSNDITLTNDFDLLCNSTLEMECKEILFVLLSNT